MSLAQAGGTLKEMRIRSTMRARSLSSGHRISSMGPPPRLKAHGVATWPTGEGAARWARLLCRPDRVDSAADELELVHDGRVVGPRSPDRINGSNHRAITDEEPVPDASRV